MTEQNTKINKFWKGNLAGTNRGPVELCLESSEKNLEGKAIFWDQVYDVALVKLTGLLEGNQAKLTIDEFISVAPKNPLGGNLTLTFDSDFKTAEGKWETEIGTSGICKIRSFPKLKKFWWFSIGWVTFWLFFFKQIKLFYIIFYLLILALDTSDNFEISFPSLILILIPGIFIFRDNLSHLIKALGLRKVGAMEFQDLTPKFPSPSPTSPELAFFLFLDKFFVPFTKLLLSWISNNKTVDFDRFKNYALTIGVQEDNIGVILEVLYTYKLITLKEEKINITEFGQRYINHLQGNL